MRTKSKVIYICGICGAEYEDKNKALSCEKWHEGFDTVISTNYSYADSRYAFPILLVEFSNGRKAKYIFNGEVEE